MKIQDWLNSAAQQLADAGVDSSRLDAELLLAHALKFSKTGLIRESDRKLNAEQLQKADNLLKQRLQRIPLAYLTGKKEFYGREFAVNQTVLIPRPETETLVETALKLNAKTALDIGTGSGCIAITLKLERPAMAVTATDISEAALETAQINAEAHKTEVVFRQSDLFAPGRYQLITANLPYVPEGQGKSPELNYEPQIALYSGLDGLKHIRKFIKKLPQHLKHNGYCLIEHLPEQLKKITRLAQLNGFKLEPINDYISLITYR